MVDHLLPGSRSAFSVNRLKVLAQNLIHSGLHFRLGLAPVDFLLKRVFHLLLEVESGRSVEILLLAKCAGRMRSSGGEEYRPLSRLVPPSVLFLPSALLRLNDRSVASASDAFGNCQ